MKACPILWLLSYNCQLSVLKSTLELKPGMLMPGIGTPTSGRYCKVPVVLVYWFLTMVGHTSAVQQPSVLPLPPSWQGGIEKTKLRMSLMISMITLKIDSRTKRFWNIHNNAPNFCAIARIEVASAYCAAFTKALMFLRIASMNLSI